MGNNEKSVVGQEPTGMTFFLARVQLAHICLEWTDTVPLETSKLLQLPYQNIIAIDTKFQDYLRNLPFFFKLDRESREKSRTLETTYPKIPIMRYCILIATHSRRCRLHQKFLLRQSFDSRYTYSRQACLESARAVIQAYEGFETIDESPSFATARMGLAVHSTHLALAVMVMDLCFNKGHVDESERKAEVEEAMQKLEVGRHVSPLLRRCLDTLAKMLQKHRVRLTASAASAADSVLDPLPGIVADVGESFYDIQSSRGGNFTPDPTFGADVLFDDIWQIATQNDFSRDADSWDTIFADLDSRPL